jgi:hypothetical protein
MGYPSNVIHDPIIIFTLILFGIASVITLVEWMLSGLWIRFFFRVGIPIFRYEAPGHTKLSSSPQSEEIEKAIICSQWLPPTLVRQLSPNEFAFREVIEGFTRYWPVMRGNLKLESAGNIRVVGFINWGLALWTILFIIIPVGWGWEYSYLIEILIALFMFVYFGSIYFAQRKRFKSVAIAAASINVDTSK